MCEQTVGTLPAPVHAPELTATQERLQDADQSLVFAQQRAQRLGTAAAKADAALSAKLDRQSALLDSLSRTVRVSALTVTLPTVYAIVMAGTTAGVTESGLLASALGEVTTIAQARAELEYAASAAADTTRAARERNQSGQADVKRAVSALADARSALLAARDPLVEMGAPQLDDSRIASGWAALARWAAEQAAVRATKLATAREEAAAAAATHQAATAAFRDAEEGLARLRTEATTATAAEQEAAAELRQITARVEELGGQLRDAPSEAEITGRLQLLDQLEEAAAKAERTLLDARRQRAAEERVLAGLERDEGTARGSLSAARDRVVALGAPTVDGLGILAAWTVLAAWAADLAVQRDQEIEGASAAVARADRATRDLAEGLRADLEREEIKLALEALAASAAAKVASAVAQARAATARMVERRAMAAGLARRQQEAQEQQQVARMLGGLLRSDNYPRWLVTEAVEDLVSVASETLSRLSSGQYDLTYDGGDFFVIDHADADSQRSARTLSGGETFQASLALALALSSQISALATVGAARLDSIFLDEGFGTLDPETLDVVATTLETLAQGDRMVGVVTHVAALAERVPVRFRVTRNAQSSTITREGFGTELAEEAME